MLRPLEVIRAYPPHDGTLHGLLESRAAADPTRTFLLFEHQSLSYAKLRARNDHIGIERGARRDAADRACAVDLSARGRTR